MLGFKTSAIAQQAFPNVSICKKTKDKTLNFSSILRVACPCNQLFYLHGLIDLDTLNFSLSLHPLSFGRGFRLRYTGLSHLFHFHLTLFLDPI